MRSSHSEEAVLHITRAFPLCIHREGCIETFQISRRVGSYCSHAKNKESTAQ